MLRSMLAHLGNESAKTRENTKCNEVNESCCVKLQQCIRFLLMETESILRFKKIMPKSHDTSTRND